MIGPQESSGGSAPAECWVVEWNDAEKRFEITAESTALDRGVFAWFKGTPHSSWPVARFVSKEAAAEYVRAIVWLKAAAGI